MDVRLLESLLLLLQVSAAMGATVATTTPSASCIDKCGDVAIPYPFGVGEGCYAQEYGNFNIVCNEKASPPKTFLNTGNIEVISISLAGQVRIKGRKAYDCYTVSGGRNTRNPRFTIHLEQYTFSHTRNTFIVVGCDTVALLGSREGVRYSRGCVSSCESLGDPKNGTCDGAGCCKTPLPRGSRNFSTAIGSFYNHSNCFDFNQCGYAFVAEDTEYSFRVSDLSDREFVNKTLPIVLDWSIGNETCQVAMAKPGFACRSSNSECSNSNNGIGYICNCSNGYEGNPYLSDPGGCQGLVQMLTSAFSSSSCPLFPRTVECEQCNCWSPNTFHLGVDINECDHQDIYPCNGTCANTPGNYICTCPQGTMEGSSKGLCIPNSTTDNKKQEGQLPLKLGVGVGLGLVCLLAISMCACWGLQRKLIEQRRKIKDLKERMFEQNGGPFLREHISSQPGNTFRIFTEEELAKATDNFQDGQIIGRGGHGIVYRGKLEDNTEVAIKKSKMVDERERKEFAREMAILSQINHVNVVKLLGCCLEVEIPMLVYEFVQCGTLCDFLHHRKHRGPISLGTRLNIAKEAAEALAYLHSYVYPPILHGDVKTSNILLDEEHRAKVSDFGASLLVPTDETQLATVVQGTCGYLDPEYLQTYQLTVKSDVYSFGVVLAELLTGKKPLHLEGPEEERGLAVNFVSSMKQNRLMQILDAQVVKEGATERLWEVAELASRCLSMRGEDRPTMKEVAVALHVLGSSREHPWVFPHAPEEVESLLGGGDSSAYQSSDATTAGYRNMENHGMMEIEAGR